MADKVTTHNKEILPTCFHYVDQNEEKGEVFLEFLKHERLTESEIRNIILTFLKQKLKWSVL